MSSEPAPARPPDARLVAKKRQKSVLGLYLGNSALIVSLNAKLKACGGWREGREHDEDGGFQGTALLQAS
jgi:hypothetical protein